jgi:RPA family protein
MPELLQKRRTAYKFWISDIANATMTKQGDAYSFFKIKNMDVTRVNVMANVTFKFIGDNNSYAALTLDDGTATIRAKAWRDDTSIFNGINLGDIVLVIGKIREYNGELYILPEVVRQLDPNWELVRKLEMLKLYGKPIIADISSEFAMPKTTDITTNIEEDAVLETSRQKVFALIENDSSEFGAKIENIPEKLGLNEEEAESIISDLLKEGEIYQVKPGYVKII